MSDLLASYFQDILDLYPSFGSFLGFRKYDGLYENTLSKEHLKSLRAIEAKYRRMLMTVKQSSTNVDILQWVLDDLKAGLTMPFDLLPITSFDNPLVDFTFQNRALYKLETDLDLKNLIQRHKSFAQFVLCAIRNMRKGMRNQIVLPRIICEKALVSLEDFLAEGRFWIPLPTKLQKSKLHSMYVRTIQEHERLLRKMASFMRFEYLPACRSTIGMAHIPNGRRMYLYSVQSQLTLSMSPEAIHKFGLSEVRRISQEMRVVQQQLGYTGNLTSFYRKMLHNPTYQFRTREAAKKAFEAKREEIRKDVIPQNFSKQVHTYDIRRVPVEMEKTSAGAFYMPGSVDGKRRGVFYLNQRNVNENLRYTVTALSLHEGEPGHHYQYQYMMENNVPLHRIYSVNGNAFVEGWALYAESLANYDNKPLDYFGKLTYELFRSVRLVVDTGIHWKGWSYDQAVRYMKRHLAMSGTEIEAEVQRYICLPAQALCYKIGEAKIQSWKKKYVQVHGEKNIHVFHDLLLEDGVLPLTVLEKKILQTL